MKKTLISFFTFLALQVVMAIFYKIGHTHPLVFFWFICVLYLVSLPKNLLSPKNIILAYYILWYGLAPAFALRFQSNTFTTNEEMLAYLMLFFTYGVSMVTLTFFESFFEQRMKSEIVKQDFYEPRKIKRIIMISITLVLISLALFIEKTGGIIRWIEDSTMAFINRRGAGGIYLLFMHSLMMFSLAFGVLLYKNKSKILYGIFFLLILVLYVFIGSKAKVMLLVFLVFGLQIINVKIVNKWTFRLISAVVIVFTLGIYQRNYTWIKSSDLLPYMLDYFNTYEMLVILIRDFEPSFLKTVVLPLNWILLKFGHYIHVPYHDISIWLTSIYYPWDHAVSATQQWPIEADLYMSFYFILGVPFLLMYLAWISYAFYMAKKGYLSWVLIYIVEFTHIVSHYRGGLVLYWYFWLIPFYLFVIIIFRKMKVSI